jgi:hypothetical protein
MLLTAHNPASQRSLFVDLVLNVSRPLARFSLLMTLAFGLGSLVPSEPGRAAMPGAEALAQQDVLSPTSAPAAPQSDILQTVAIAQSISPIFPAQGTYLFGQAPEADQLGAGYMVFEVTGETIIGALYVPHSSFDCFQGQIQGNELAMMITQSYTQEVYPYAIALTTADAIASTGEALSPLSLEGFHQITTVSDNDIRMLETCKAHLQPQ